MFSKRWILAGLLLCAAGMPIRGLAGGVTVITHGYDGDVTGWIAAMAEQIPFYYASNRYPSTNLTVYTVTLTTDGTDYYYQWTRDSGGSPSNTDTGEIIVKLDWSQLSGGTNPYDISTYVVASLVSSIFLATNGITDLNGHALTEYPLHLVGHSRGGSLMAQLSYILGTNGLWVDHLTTIDPHPLNNDGNDDFPISTEDAPAKYTYVNVLYADNYWEDLGEAIPTDLDPHGEPVAGAYQRQLTSLNGGYPPEELDFFDDYEFHSNSHLWYYGTMDSNTPVSYNDDGTTVTITSSMRSSWWVAYEQEGNVAGFYYSLIGGGNRMSGDHPLGLPSDPAIVDGYNQWWNFGAGTSSNRTTLPSNNGTWPNLIQFDITGTNTVTAGQEIAARFYYQYGGAASNVTAQFYFGSDYNPYGTGNLFSTQFTAPNTGTGSVYYSSFNLATAQVPSGTYAVYGKISDGSHTRFLYAPQLVQVLAPPRLTLGFTNQAGQEFVTISGAGILQSSGDLQAWQPIATNTNSSGVWLYPIPLPSAPARQFFRAAVAP